MESELGSSPTGFKKEPTDFMSGLKLPVLDVKPRAKVKRGIRKGKGKEVSEDPNSKVRLFKNSHKEDILSSLLGTGVGEGGEEAHFQPTGLFGSNSNQDPSDAESDQVDVLSKVKGFIGRRKKNQVDEELHTRISQAFDKMEYLEKGVRSFDDTLLLAKGRLAEVARRGRATLSNSPRGSELTDHDSAPGSPRSPLAIQPQHVPKLDPGAPNIAPMKPEDEANSEEVAGDDADKMCYPLKPASTSINLSEKGSPSQRLAPRLRLHESSGNHGLESVKGKIQVMKMKSEREDRKTKVSRSKLESTYTGEGNLTRLMIDNPNQGPAKELMDFLQAHGGSTGGWDKEDQDIFLLAYLKWKHMPVELIRSVSAQCPGRRMQEVAAHLDWYNNYERLNAANKAYVRQWKINKRRERQQMYKMARQDAKAKIEGEKSRQEIIKEKREVERERERMTLYDWKKSKENEMKKLEVETDILRDPDGAGRTTKLMQNLQVTKEKLVKLLPLTHQVRKVLTKSRLPLELNQRREIAVGKSVAQKEDLVLPSLLSPSLSSEPERSSSEGFLETLDIILAKQNGQEKSRFVKSGLKDKRASKMKLKNALSIKDAPSKTEVEKASVLIPELASLFVPKRRSREKMLAHYRNRDDKIVSAKLNAIRSKKESQKNKAFLSTDETKERISQINLASKVTRMTKGVKLRQNIRELEVIEASVREELKKSLNPHLISRVPSPEMFKTGPTLDSIPKLGAPAWRKS